MASQPEKWFDLSESGIENATWLFTNISKSDFLNLRRSLLNTKAQSGDQVLQNYASLCGGLGTIFCILLILTLYRKAFTEKISFYKIMITIAGLDFMYCFFVLFYNIFYREFKLRGSTNPDAMWIMIAIRGPMYTLSCVSDMCSVALTLERYLAVTKPQLHMKLLEKRHLIQTFIALVIIILASSRMHYSMEKTVVQRGQLYYYTSSQMGSTAFVVGLATFSDAILPVLLFASMSALSILFLLSIVRRHKTKMNKVAVANVTNVTAVNVKPLPGVDQPETRSGQAPIATVTQSSKPQEDKEKVKQKELKSMITLTLALDALFLMNQMGYCIYLICQQLDLHIQPIFYDCTYSEISRWVMINQAAVLSDTLSVYTEILAHALNFPLYLSLSKSTRKEFFGVLKKMVKCSKI